MSRFPGFRSLRDRLRESQKGLEFCAKMSGKPVPPELVREVPPKRASPVRDPSRVSEAQVNDMIREYSARRDDLVLWRNVSGMTTGANGAPMRFGVGPNGAADWLGYRQVVISPEMVGSVIAQFVSVEAKAPDNPKLEDAQQRFLKGVNKAGGAAIVVRERRDIEKL